MRFVILPDHPAAAGPMVTELEAQGARIVRHGSGRPWLIGWWADEELVLATAGDKRVAVLGRTTATSEVLTRELNSIRSNADVNRLAGEISGCFHLISSLSGQVRAQGSLAGIYRIYYATVNGVTLATDRPDWLVRWTGASLDEELLPLWLLVPYGPPWPLSNRCLWRGVNCVAPDHYLELDRDGYSRTVPWWRLPEPEFSRAEGAARVRATLEESIRARAGKTGATRLSFDLSGGMDSTSLCYLADRLGYSFTSIHYAMSDPANPDRIWAERAQQDLKSSNHLLFPAKSLPGYYIDQVQPPSEIGLEGPSTLLPRSVIAHLAERSAETGASRHLQGHGSDVLFVPDLSLLNAMLRRHPWRRLRSLQARKARGRLSLATAWKHFRSPGSYRNWLLRVAGSLDDRSDLKQDGGWEFSPRPPEWATPQTVAQIRSVLKATAQADPEPLAPHPAAHALLRGLQIGGQLIRQSSMIGERVGVSFEAPYLDDRMLEAALSIRVEERFQAKINKPVLATAMRGVVPQTALDRRDKSNGDREMYDGIRRSRSRLEEVLAEPRLAQLGLVKADVLREVVLGLQTKVDRLNQLEPTWACEMWLRSLSEAGHETPTMSARQPALVGQ